MMRKGIRKSALFLHDEEVAVRICGVLLESRKVIEKLSILSSKTAKSKKR
jgi:hypothetical protein